MKENSQIWMLRWLPEGKKNMTKTQNVEIFVNDTPY